MHRNIAEKWCVKLRSGEYKQGTKVLHNLTDDTFCCLGVLCQMYLEDVGDFSYLGEKVEDVEFGGDDDEEPVLRTVTVRSYNWSTDVLPEAVMRWSGMTTATGCFDRSSQDTLAELNDVDGLSFDELAEVIEENVENL